jgi:hypothetical protein
MLREENSLVKMDDQLADLLWATEHLSNLNNRLPESPAVSLDDFVDQCSELIEGMNPRQHNDPQKRSIKLPKSKLWITPFQLWEGWRMLNQRERTGLRGGIQASSAGTGKSYMCLTALLLRGRIFESERQVKESWRKPEPSGKSPQKARPAQHLPYTAGASEPNMRCPSQKPGDIVCYCVPTSRARIFIDFGIAPRGVSLVQAPLAVLDEWIPIFRDAVLDPSAYNIVIVHPNVPPSLRRNFGQITNALKPGAKGPDHALETYIFCSAHNNAKVLETLTARDISVGVMFSDESHKAMKLESGSMAIAQSQSSLGDGLDLWLISATPITRLLEDFELPVRIFSNSTHLSRARSMETMVASYATVRDSYENQTAFCQRWDKVFDSDLVLRSTDTSQFCGKAITNLQIVDPKKLMFHTEREHLEAVQEVAYLAREKIRNKELWTRRMEQREFRLDYASEIDARLHFVSLFPGAASLILQETDGFDVEEESIQMEIAAMNFANKLRVEKIESYQQHLEQVSHGSPKLMYILEEIGRMRADRAEREGDPEVQASPRKESLSMKKMVIITPTLGTAVWLYLFLLKRVPDLHPVCLHGQASASDREAALNSFQSLTARPYAKHSYILIAPFSVGGTGLNLQSANYQILVYPPSTRTIETQAFARTNRTGQRLPLHHTVLITQDNPADRINVVNSAGRSIRNDPFEIGRRLVLAELDGSKKVQRLEDWGYGIIELDDPEGECEIYLALDFPTVGEGQFGGVRIITALRATGEGVDKLIYFSRDTVASGTVCVTQAWNNDEGRPRHETLPLRDITLGVWVYYLGRDVRDLTTMMYSLVVENNLSLVVRPRVYALMNEQMTNSLVIYREARSQQEAEAFRALVEGAPFCIGAQKMLDEYREFAGIQIESFVFDVVVPKPAKRGDLPYFNFKINFR